MRKLFVLIAVGGLISCSQPSSCSQAAGSSSAADSSSRGSANAVASDEVRFYGRERFTIVAIQTGLESGTFVEHVRDWGRKRVEIKDVTLSVMGISRPTRNRVVYDGARIATVDLESGAVTLATNPLYERIAAALRGRSGVDYGEQVMTQMGGRRTGERGTFAGQECEYWEVAQLGARNCVTPWGATLYARVTMGPVSFERTATEVRLDDGGPDEAFSYDASRATEAPNLDDIRRKMRGQ